MNREELHSYFKGQFNDQLDSHVEVDPKCSLAAGMLLILSALKAKDGPSMAYQVAIMHSALREIGDERGWGVASNRPSGI